MDLSTIIEKRLRAKAEHKRELDLQTQIEQVKQNGRELLARAYICEWIERTYGISFDPRNIGVSENRLDNLGQGHYSLRIDLNSEAWIDCNREMIVSFNDCQATIETSARDLADQVLFTGAWTAHRNRYTDTCSDLIEAAIYALDAEHNEIPTEF